MPSLLFQVLNLDLLTVGISVAGMTILGCVIFLSNSKGVVNRIFLALSLSASMWGVVNYLSYQVSSPAFSFVLLRLVLFFAVWSAFFTYYLAVVFTPTNFGIFKIKNIVILLISILVSLLTVTDYVFKDIGQLGTGDRAISSVVNGPGILVFGVWVMFLNIGAIVNLVLKYLRANTSQRKSLRLILLGMGIMLGLISIFNFALPAFLSISSFIPLGALFLLPFIFLTGYAISRHRLFNIKVVGTSLLVFALSITTFVEIVFSENITVVFHRSMVLVLVLVFGILLIRGVLHEIEQREKIEKQEKELEAINAKLADANERLQELDKQKTEFLSMASHQLRSPLTAIKGYASLILEGDYGTITDDLKHAVQIMFDSANTLAVVVSDYLNVTRIELGKMKYDFATLDLRDLVREVTDELRPNIEKAGLTLEVSGDLSREYRVEADKEKLKQVLMNIVDNSVKYTPKGSVTVSLSGTISSSKRGPGTVVFAVKDTGIGIAPDVLPKLFGKFVRANNANKQNIRGTGLGLFIAKQIVEAHKGRIWAESEGEGKGSQFCLELPLGK